MKNFFIFFLGFFGLFFSNGSKAAEIINIKFEEMKIPFTIEQLSRLEKYKDESTELMDWLKNNGYLKEATAESYSAPKGNDDVDDLPFNGIGNL